MALTVEIGDDGGSAAHPKFGVLEFAAGKFILAELGEDAIDARDLGADDAGEELLKTGGEDWC
jgi:hypothetical protein